MFAARDSRGAVGFFAMVAISLQSSSLNSCTSAGLTMCGWKIIVPSTLFPFTPSHISNWEKRRRRKRRRKRRWFCHY